ncbi:hypothetical protein GAP32_020 [Cronobacter phage vB_CsaM_GAP32]|uniref:Uncharacterized protein n=1 Tax=Cronobacter phage vB_CsaM_GAP32 TaxID=1141136 RepID=K4F6D1_9CAUD|nr:hypothetical protein GAP32_020 [Cronobacter phage vB_CsaM_GAP32]AFC21468.1 hypothetical protein GAP32_020 [Cronobacter phage vB_CsaM_GAP32]
MREFALYDKVHLEREYPLSTKKVLDTLPVLTDLEVEIIINLKVSESIEINNTVIIRTM